MQIEGINTAQALFRLLLFTVQQTHRIYNKMKLRFFSSDILQFLDSILSLLDHMLKKPVQNYVKDTGSLQVSDDYIVHGLLNVTS